nr:hypothetical protein [Kibdelosporangium sp. MJ126-NF4]CTQ89997.1 hypothetical protein [Kibdelosporangium sp. MJ126-NF4]
MGRHGATIGAVSIGTDVQSFAMVGLGLRPSRGDQRCEHTPPG